MSTALLRPFWLVAAAVALSLSWLLPNHTPPWLGFHADAWAAVVLTGVAAGVIWRSKSTPWPTLALLTAALIGLVGLQHVFGLIRQFGVAWINILFLTGLLLALLVGRSWERASPRQCADLLFIAAAAGAVISVGVQWHQWLGWEPLGPWILKSPGSRHFANMVQPNQLASLLLLGLLGCAWLHLRGQLNGIAAVVLAVWLLFGLALTESRTGWLNTLLIVAAFWMARRFAGMRHVSRVAIGLAGFYFLTVAFLLPTLNGFYGASGVPVAPRSIEDSPRINLWTMLIEAAALRPWTGFGWGQVSHAEFLMPIERMYPGASAQQAHNLVLDLVLWNGVPIGLAVAALLAVWAWRVVRRISDPFQLLMALFLGVLGIHAMLEYPLQYAYFLLPAGLMIGALEASVGLRPVFEAPRSLTASLLIGAAAMLTLTVRDYFRVETSFYGLRFEQRKIQTSIPPVPPDVQVLTQWRDYIHFARLEPSQVHHPEALAWASDVVRTMPSALGMYKVAAMLAFAGQPDEAQRWLQILCRINPAAQCDIVKTMWAKQSAQHAPIAAVPWPDSPR